MNKFYRFPMQVKFRGSEDVMEDEGREHWFGIAYHDEVICGCCGGIFQISELDWIEDYYGWKPLEKTIGGKDYDNSFVND